jgi:hypothetical protein
MVRFYVVSAPRWCDGLDQKESGGEPGKLLDFFGNKIRVDQAGVLPELWILAYFLYGFHGKV